MRALGKLLQLIGLGLPLIAVLAQLSNAISLGRMLVMMLAALAAFYIGRILEGYFGQQ